MCREKTGEKKDDKVMRWVALSPVKLQKVIPLFAIQDSCLSINYAYSLTKLVVCVTSSVMSLFILPLKKYPQTNGKTKWKADISSNGKRRRTDVTLR